jgi:hypothetical protein
LALPGKDDWARYRRGGKLSVWLPLVVGLVLFAAGLRQSVAALDIYLAISRTLSAGDISARPSENPVADGLKVEAAPRWAEAQDLFHLAWAKNRLLATRGPSEASATLLASATRDAERTVAGAPGYSPGWLMLADLRREAGAPAKEVAQLLQISILTAPFDPYRVLGRLNIGFSIYPSLDGEGRDLLASQVQMAWRSVPEDLVKFTLTPDHPNRLFLIRLALAPDPSVLAAFEKLLARMR